MRTVLAAVGLIVTSLAVLPVQDAEASTLTSGDGYTTLGTIGAVTPGTPYTSGQQIDVTVAANSVLDNANLVAHGVPGQTPGNPLGIYYVYECTDPGGLPANLPTQPQNCEAATVELTDQKSSNGALSLTGINAFTVYDLPDVDSLGPATMTGTCDVAPNQCVLGIFAANIYSQGGFGYPHLFSAPFQVTVGDGQDNGDNPGDGTPETPFALALPILALGLLGSGVWVRRRRSARV